MIVFENWFTYTTPLNLAYVGQLFNGFDPIWEVVRNKLQLMVLYPKSLA